MAAVSLQDLIDRKKDQLACSCFGKSGLAKKFPSECAIFIPMEEFWTTPIRDVLIVGREEFSDFAAGARSPRCIFNNIRQLKCLRFFFRSHFFPASDSVFRNIRDSFLCSRFDPYLLRAEFGFLRKKSKGATIQGVCKRVRSRIIYQRIGGLGKSECAWSSSYGATGLSPTTDRTRKEGTPDKGRSPEISRNLLYIKGIGIINTKDLYGECAVLPQSGVDMIVEFVEWKKDINVMGHEIVYNNIMDINIPLTIIPVRPNQMTTILEVVAKKYLFEKGASAPKNIQRQDR